MPEAKADIISRLKMEILSLEGLGKRGNENDTDYGLGFMSDAFPDHHFPLGAVHEFIAGGMESAAASAGFIGGILSRLMKDNGACAWIGSSGKIFPPALKMFDIAPERMLFIDLKKEKDMLWAMEETLKCSGLAAVIGEMPELGFTPSRRFQLAVEQSRVTGFILRQSPRALFPNACVSRWRISPLPSFASDDLPGPSFPRWNVELLKIRNGKPGSWQVEWSDGRFRPISETIASILREEKRKAG
jgi:protein ImuA